MDSIIGKTVGSYRILEQIGEGGMATVYKAYQPALNRDVAVKILPPQFAKEPGFTKRFQREAHAVAQLEHRHILPIYDYGQDDDLSFLVMRYVDGGTLKQLMLHPLDLRKIVDLIEQIAEALDYAHKKGFVHRDVKPSNILLDQEGRILLADFGLARMLEGSQQITATGVGIGTPDYMSPEQGLGERVDHRTDIYSLGVVLYEMLTGRVPYHAETPMAVVLKHINDPLPLPSSLNPEIPENVERVVLKAMAKAREDRYHSAGDLARALRDTVRNAETTVKEPWDLKDIQTEVKPTTKPKPSFIGEKSKYLLWTLLPVLLIVTTVIVISKLPVRLQITGGRLELTKVTTVSSTPESSREITATEESLSSIESTTMLPTIDCMGASEGEKVTLLNQLSDWDEESLSAMAEPLLRACGVTLIIESLPDQESLFTELHTNNPWDVVISPTTNTLRRYRHLLTPLDEASAHIENYEANLIRLGTVDEEWLGVPINAHINSLVWYQPSVFEKYGYSIPQTFKDLIDLTDQMVVDGQVPWAMGFESGEATGWTGSDFIQDLLLTQQGPDYILGLIDGSIRYDDEGVIDAYEIYMKWASDPKYTVGGTSGTINTFFYDAIFMPFEDPPQAMMVRQADFAGEQIAINQPGLTFPADYNYFLFPGLQGYQGGIDWLMVFNASPAAKAFVAYLTSAEGAQCWSSFGPGYSLNKHAISTYSEILPPEISKIFSSIDLLTPDLGDMIGGEFTSSERNAIIEVLNGRDVRSALNDVAIIQMRELGKQ